MRILIGALAGCATLAVVGAAVAASSGLYLGGGVALRGTTANLEYTDGTKLRPSFDESPAYVLNLGYRFPIPVRVEGEFGFNKSYANPDTGGFRGSLEQWTAMLNIAYDIPLTDRLSLTVGGGGGYVKTLGRIHSGGLDYLHDDNDATVWQAMGGIAFQVFDELELFAEYRYQDYGESQHTSSFVAVNPVRLVDAHSHNFMFGLRFFPQPLFL